VLFNTTKQRVETLLSLLQAAPTATVARALGQALATATSTLAAVCARRAASETAPGRDLSPLPLTADQLRALTAPGAREAQRRYNTIAYNVSNVRIYLDEDTAPALLKQISDESMAYTIKALGVRDWGVVNGFAQQAAASVAPGAASTKESAAKRKRA